MNSNTLYKNFLYSVIEAKTSYFLSLHLDALIYFIMESDIIWSAQSSISLNVDQRKDVIGQLIAGKSQRKL